MASPLMIDNPKFENVVGKYLSEDWNFGFNFGYSVFGRFGDAKVEWGAWLNFYHWNIKNMVIEVDEYYEFNYYGIDILAGENGEIMNTKAKISGGVGDGSCNIFQISPSLRWKLIDKDNLGLVLQPGIGMYIFERTVKDLIHEFQDNVSIYKETDLHAGISLGLGINLNKKIEIMPYYQTLLTHNLTHFGSLSLIYTF
jgi:hypothetical protein